ncbi:hypothetical protein [Moorena producens]
MTTVYYSLFPTPDSRLPTPDSRLPTPRSAVLCSLWKCSIDSNDTF